MGVGITQSTRLVRTELNYVHNRAELDSIEDAGLKWFVFMATLDNRTSDICASSDRMEFPVSEAEIGLNVPPLHPNCRSTIAGSLHNGFAGERIAKDAKSASYHVPASMNYEEWKAVYVDKTQSYIHKEASYIQHNGTNNAFTANYALINTKAYHDKFDKLTSHKQLDEALYVKAVQFLEHRSGSPYEDIAMLDYQTGKTLVENLNASGRWKFQSGLTRGQIAFLRNMKRPFEIMHNHPGSTAPSKEDILGLFEREMAKGSTVIGHDGTVYRLVKLRPNVPLDIDVFITAMYNTIKDKYPQMDREEIETLTARETINALQRGKFLKYYKR